MAGNTVCTCSGSTALSPAAAPRPALRAAVPARRAATDRAPAPGAYAPPAPARNRAARPPRARCAPGAAALSTSAPLRTAGVSFSSSRRSPCSSTRRSEAAVRIAEAHAHQEAIELRFRQAIGADLLVRILGRHHEERLGQWVGHAIDADLPFLHRLEQRALRLRAGPIDLIGEQQLREHRAAPELEFVRVAIEDRYADDVGRQHVAGELHPRPLQAEHAREACARAWSCRRRARPRSADARAPAGRSGTAAPAGPCRG